MREHNRAVFLGRFGIEVPVFAGLGRKSQPLVEPLDFGSLRMLVYHAVECRIAQNAQTTGQSFGRFFVFGFGNIGERVGRQMLDSFHIDLTATARLTRALIHCLHLVVRRLLRRRHRNRVERVRQFAFGRDAFRVVIRRHFVLKRFH